MSALMAYDDNILLFPGVRSDKRPNCGAGTKLCGKRCVPKDDNCSSEQTKKRTRSGVIAGAVGTVAGITALNIAQNRATERELGKTLNRKDAKRLRCSPGNKQCGDKCVPSDSRCSDSGPRKGSFRKGLKKGVVGALATIGAASVIGNQAQHVAGRAALKNIRGDSNMKYDDGLLVFPGERVDRKRLNCSPGNKQCGDRCVPATAECSDEKKSRKSSKSRSGGRSTLARGLVAAAVTGAAGGGILISRQGTNNQKGPNPGDPIRPTSSGSSTGVDFKNIAKKTAKGAAVVGVGLAGAKGARMAGDAINKRAADRNQARQARSSQNAQSKQKSGGKASPVVINVRGSNNISPQPGSLAPKPKLGIRDVVPQRQSAPAPAGKLARTKAKKTGSIVVKGGGATTTRATIERPKGMAALRSIGRDLDRAAQQKMREELNPAVIQKRRSQVKKVANRAAQETGKVILGTFNMGRRAQARVEEFKSKRRKKQLPPGRRDRMDSRMLQQSGSIYIQGASRQRR